MTKRERERIPCTCTPLVTIGGRVITVSPASIAACPRHGRRWAGARVDGWVRKVRARAS